MNISHKLQTQIEREIAIFYKSKWIALIKIFLWCTIFLGYDITC